MFLSEDWMRRGELLVTPGCCWCCWTIRLMLLPESDGWRAGARRLLATLNGCWPWADPKFSPYGWWKGGTLFVTLKDCLAWVDVKFAFDPLASPCTSISMISVSPVSLPSLSVNCCLRISKFWTLFAFAAARIALSLLSASAFFCCFLQIWRNFCFDRIGLLKAAIHLKPTG